MKRTVGFKIASMNALAIFIIFILGISNYLSTDRMLESLSWQEKTYQVKNKLNGLLALINEAETGVRGYMITRNDKYLEPYTKAIPAVNVQINNIKNLMTSNLEVQNKINKLERLIDSRLSLLQNILKINDIKKEIVEVENGKVVMDNIRLSIAEMINVENDMLSKRIEESNNATKITYSIIVYGSLLAIALLILAGIYLTQNIAKPLGEMTDLANKIAAGEIDGKFIPLKREDEVGELSQTFSRMSLSLQELSKAARKVASGDLTVKIIPQSNKDVLGNSLAQMITNLRQFTKENNEVVNLLNTSVNEIFTSISQLVSSGSETAAAVNEATSTIEEVRQTSQISSQKAKIVSDSAQISSNISRDGAKSTQETSDGIVRIRDQMNMIAESMMQLSEQAQGISSIVETVDDLAQQSNLLSVNASIEAEKVGDQGKGFRIVAQEIKSLADQSKQATHRVREILSDVQKATSTAVLATEQGTKYAEGGVIKSVETGEAINKLSNNVTDSAQAALQIASSSQQQLIGLEQAAAAMENIKQASIQNVDSAKQLETATHNLKEISSKLEKLIKKYRASTDYGATIQ